jgi:rSAM/selenodomain-associated transferase 1
VRQTLLTFLKAPRPGQVKTRLISDLGAEAAGRLYARLAEAAVRATRPNGEDYERVFCFAPPDAGREIAAWFPGEAYWPQPDRDLGGRMADAFDNAFAQGAARAAVVGTDVPWVGRDRVVEALQALETDDVAIGPARDGGYYLLALRARQPSLFEGIAWSTPSVLDTTLARARRAGLTVRTLAAETDLDTLDDLRSEWARLEPLLSGDPDLLARLRPLVGRGRP